MPPKSDKISADDFEKKYGKLVREKYAEFGTAYKLDKALRAHKPAICMTQGLLKQWLLNGGGRCRISHVTHELGRAALIIIKKPQNGPMHFTCDTFAKKVLLIITGGVKMRLNA